MKKMLKAVSGFAVACLLVIGICATVFAAGSQSDGTNVTSDNAAFVANPNAAEVQMDEATARQLTTKTDGTVAVYNWDMYTTDGSAATVTFNPKGATAAQTLYVYHFKNGSWHLEAQGVGPTVTTTFNDFSPVALVVYTAGQSPTPGPTPTPTPTPSPKTGEVDYVLFAALAALLAGGIAVAVAVRKNKA